MELVIESVRKYPCLWKTDIPEYKNNELKEAAWREVVKECGLLDVKEARNTWKKLRDGHRQALARKKTTTGQEAAGTVLKWKYEQQMEFLLPTMSNRPRQSNVGSPHQEDSVRNDDSQSVSGEPDSEDNESPYAFACHNKKQPKLVNIMENEIKRREKRCAERDDLRRQILNSTSTHHSALEKFFASMFETTSNLSDRLQLRVQRQVFNIVMEAKEEHLTEQVVASTPGPSSSILQTPLTSNAYNIRGATPFRLPSQIRRPNSTFSNYSENENSLEPLSQYVSNTQPPNICREEEEAQYTFPHSSIQNMSNESSSMTQHNVEQVCTRDESVNILNIRSFIQDCDFK